MHLIKHVLFGLHAPKSQREEYMAMRQEGFFLLHKLFVRAIFSVTLGV